MNDITGRDLIAVGFEPGPELGKALEAESAKLKKLLAEIMMDVPTLKEMLRKSFLAPDRDATLRLGP